MAAIIEENNGKVKKLISENKELLTYTNSLHDTVLGKISSGDDYLQSKIQRLQRQINVIIVDEENDESEVESISSNSLSIGSNKDSVSSSLVSKES